VFLDFLINLEPAFSWRYEALYSLVLFPSFILILLSQISVFGISESCRQRGLFVRKSFLNFYFFSFSFVVSVCSLALFDRSYVFAHAITEVLATFCERLTRFGHTSGGISVCVCVSISTIDSLISF
jgi:hypothetical protein